jgi:hypothetical protein
MRAKGFSRAFSLLTHLLRAKRRQYDDEVRT